MEENKEIGTAPFSPQKQVRSQAGALEREVEQCVAS